MNTHDNEVYPDAEKIARETFDAAWKAIAHISVTEGAKRLHDEFVAAHIKAIANELNKAYRAGLIEGDEQTSYFLSGRE